MRNEQDSAENLPWIRYLEGRCLQRLEASETPLGAARDSPPTSEVVRQVEETEKFRFSRV